jgi:hypothetical protein
MSLRLEEYEYLVMTCIRRPCVEVATQFQKILKEHGNADRYRTHWSTLDLSSIYEGAPPAGGRHLRRAVIFTPGIQRPGCVFMANMQDGWYTMVNCLSERLRSTIIHIVSTKATVEFPTTALTTWAQGRQKRVVRAAFDGGNWEFFQRGAFLDWENPELYKRHRISQRLNRGILLDYMSKLGWSLGEDAFWISKGKAFYADELRRWRPGPAT